MNNLEVVVESNTRFTDMLALFFWLYIRSRTGGIAIILAGLFLTLVIIFPKLDFNNIPLDILKLFICFSFACFVLIVLFIPIAGIDILINYCIKGNFGRRYFSISEDCMIEKDKYKETRASWKEVRKIVLTSNYIFMRISRFKYLIIPKRDFSNEYEFANYYAELVKFRERYS